MIQRTKVIQPDRPGLELATWFKTLRKKSLNLTQRELSERTDIPLGTIRYFEQTGRASLQNFLRMAAELHVLGHFLGLVREGGTKTFKQVHATPTASGSVSLATKLGTVPHVSPLLRKLARHGMKTPEEMAACAVGRGCRHYANMPNWKNIRPHPAPGISNEELAIGLLSPCHPYEPLLIRIGCQLLSAPQTNPECLTRLAAMERCAPVLKYIATCGSETEPDNPFWKEILNNLQKHNHPQPEFPKNSIHISRFRAETGITNPFKPDVPKAVWLRPQNTA